MTTFENEQIKLLNLKSCPGCGNSKAFLFKHARRQKDLKTKEWFDISEYSVVCGDCSFRTGPLVMNPEKVIADWNKRR